MIELEDHADRVTRIETMYVFTSKKVEGVIWDPVKVAYLSPE